MSTARSTIKKPAGKGAGPNKRNSLIEVIARLFYEMGYEKTSTREIAKAMGVPNSALYYYFRSKQEMLFAIVDGLMENVIQNLKEKVEVIRDPEERLLFIIQEHIKSFVAHKYESKVLIYEDHCLEGEFKQIIEDKERQYFDSVRKSLAEIIRTSGSSIDANVATFSLFGMLNWIYKWYDPDGKVPPDELSGQIFKMVLTGLKGKRPAKVSSKK